jgi:hypothetical protein
MERCRRLGASAVLATAAALGPAVSAGAADGDGSTATITATITGGAIGSRSVTSVAPVALDSTLGSANLTGTLAVVVTEASRTGTNGWSVTAQAGDLTRATGTETIPASALSVSGRSVAQTLGGGTSTATSGSQSLDSPRTLFSNSGQSTGAVYTGTYSASGNLSLTVPNGTLTGVYTGTLTVTLVQ